MKPFKVKGDKRFLVIGRVGDSSIHQEWLQPAAYKNFDLCLSYFGSTPGRYADECDFYQAIPGLKWPTVKDTIALFGKDILHYDAIWMPDDDISANAYDINRMFHLFMEQGLELAQPALTPDSFFAHGITVKKNDYLLRYSHFVEPMVPLYSRNAFQKLLPTFDKSESGWGLDFVWPKVLGFPYRKIGVIDEVTVKHTRRVGGGELYKNISGSQWDDLYRITKEYGADVNFRMMHYDGIPKSRKAVFAILASKDEQVLAAQIDNIRHFNPEASIVLYNRSEDLGFAKGLNAARCPYSRPLAAGSLTPYLLEVMKWLKENQVKYKYLIHVDDETLFVKRGFVSSLDETMKGCDCGGWEGQLSSSLSQVFRYSLIQKVLEHVNKPEIESWLAVNEAADKEGFLFARLAADCGAKYRQFQRDPQLNAMRHDPQVEQAEAHHAQHHSGYYTIHPVRGDLLRHYHGQLMAGGIPMPEPPPAPEPPPVEPAPVIAQPVIRRYRRRKSRIGQRKVPQKRTGVMTKLASKSSLLPRRKYVKSTKYARFTYAANAKTVLRKASAAKRLGNVRSLQSAASAKAASRPGKASTVKRTGTVRSLQSAASAKAASRPEKASTAKRTGTVRSLQSAASAKAASRPGKTSTAKRTGTVKTLRSTGYAKRTLVRKGTLMSGKTRIYTKKNIEVLNRKSATARHQLRTRKSSAVRQLKKA
ncbi:DUF707 domain-containing protein [Paenibacillus aestuarii]|uniref:DUF707 domain-containing protein n=1 Tax=Paenibacillus aestuarii TaxID=516965 RepID=A0ABW0K436_9BACL|nr:DUF707 domain-containing protein [Paenibacillus aestuarii]